MGDKMNLNLKITYVYSWKRIWFPKPVISICNESTLSGTLSIDGDLVLEEEAVLYCKSLARILVKGNLQVNGEIRIEEEYE